MARSSGTIQMYSLPRISLQNKCTLRCRPAMLSLNSDSSLLSVIDGHNVLRIVELEPPKGADRDADGAEQPFGKVQEQKRNDVWAIKWAEDNPQLYVAMEKTRMIIVEDGQPQDPVQSSGYVCDFKELQVRAVLLDEIMAKPLHTSKKQVLAVQTKRLREVAGLLQSGSLQDAYKFINNNPHKRLWRLLAEKALEKTDLNLADKAFIRMKDYHGIMLVKRLKKIGSNSAMCKAEVAAYLGKLEEAEAAYREMDRRDLAVELQSNAGDWFRVAQLVQGTGGGANDEMVRKAWRNIGAYYLDRQQYDKAAQYYRQGQDPAMLVECQRRLGDYSAMQKMVVDLPDESPLLLKLGTELQAVGLHRDAVDAFVKGGDIKAAVDCCVLLNQWEKAVELAEQHAFPQVQSLLSQYASHLMESGGPQGKLAAVELYRRAKKSAEAAQLLSEMAKAAMKRGSLRQAKRLQVLCALELEDFKARTLAQEGGGDEGGATTVQATLNNLMTLDAATISSTGALSGADQAWKRAEAYHFAMLGTRLLYQGNVAAAAQVAEHLSHPQFDGALDDKYVYSTLALTSFFNKHFGQCSKAFVRLEALPGLDEKEHKGYEELALQIFMHHPPTDPPGYQERKEKAGHEQRPRLCTASGMKIGRRRRVYMCSRCRRYAYEAELRDYSNCPLCHGSAQKFMQPSR